MIRILRRNPEFSSRLLKLGVPVLVSNLIMSSLNFVDVAMVGQLGPASLAAVGIGFQIAFTAMMFAWGIAAACGLFIAQYWGKGDVAAIRRMIGIGLAHSIVMGALFLVFMAGFPRLVMSLFTVDPAVRNLGAAYVRTISWGLPFTMVSMIFATACLNTEHSAIWLISNLTGLGLNTLLNWILIFGNLGFPALGVKGAATATLVSRIVQCLMIIAVTYGRKLPSAARIGELLSFDASLVRRFWGKGAPVILQNAAWSVGTAAYTAVYGRIGTGAIAAYNVAGSIERLALSLFSSLGHAAAVMMGNRVGAGEKDKAYDYGVLFLSIAAIGGVVFGGSVILFRKPLLGLYELGSEAARYASGIITVMGAMMWGKATNMVFHMGVFRSGGDTAFSMFVDLGGVWLVGIPMALFTGLILGWPIPWVVAAVLTEEIVKIAVGYPRFVSRRWIHDLTTEPKDAEDREAVVDENSIPARERP